MENIGQVLFADTKWIRNFNPTMLGSFCCFTEVSLMNHIVVNNTFCLTFLHDSKNTRRVLEIDTRVQSHCSLLSNLPEALSSVLQLCLRVRISVKFRTKHFVTVKSIYETQIFCSQVNDMTNRNLVYPYSRIEDKHWFLQCVNPLLSFYAGPRYIMARCRPTHLMH